MRLVLLGAPGAGKGTQGQRLAKVLDVPEISTGDLLRAAVEAGTPLGRAAKSVMDAGQLVSDDIVLGVIRERLAQPDVRDGFILDGFPRNVAQAEALDELLAQIGQPIELVLLINVDTDWLLQRLVGRRTCVSCGAMYNIFSAPPKMDDRCDECGGRLRQRADDNEETIGNRLRIYDTQTAPLIQRYRESGRLRTVSGVGSVDDVFRAVMKVVEEERANRKVPDRADVIRSAIVRQQTVAKTRRAKTPKPAPQASADTGSGAGATTVPAATTAAKPKAPAKPKAAKSGAKAPAKPAAATGTAAKKTGAAKTAASGTTAKKAAGKKAPGKPAAPAKATAKKPTAKKTAPAKKAAKKSATKTAPAKKSAAKAKRKAAAKKAPAKSAARKKAAKKTGTRKTATRKAPARKAPARKTAAKKVPATKAAAKKGAAGKKSAARRSASGAKKRR